MTICVWDGTTLAVDSRMTMGGTVVSDDFNKMMEVNHPELGKMICVVTGACPFIGPWMEYISSNGFGPVPVLGQDDDYQCSGLFVDEDGDCWQASTDGGYFLIGKTPMAAGSGVPVAQYLLSKGKNAVAVAKEICKENLYCGGTVRSYNVKTKKITLYEP